MKKTKEETTQYLREMYDWVCELNDDIHTLDFVPPLFVVDEIWDNYDAGKSQGLTIAAWKTLDELQRYR